MNLPEIKFYKLPDPVSLVKSCRHDLAGFDPDFIGIFAEAISGSYVPGTIVNSDEVEALNQLILGTIERYHYRVDVTFSGYNRGIAKIQADLRVPLGFIPRHVKGYEQSFGMDKRHLGSFAAVVGLHVLAHSPDEALDKVKRAVVTGMDFWPWDAIRDAFELGDFNVVKVGNDL